MDLIDALRSTGAVRDYTGEPVGDDVLTRVLDIAGFAPSGGNASFWRRNAEGLGGVVRQRRLPIGSVPHKPGNTS